VLGINSLQSGDKMNLFNKKFLISIFISTFLILFINLYPAYSQATMSNPLQPISAGSVPAAGGATFQLPDTTLR